MPLKFPSCRRRRRLLSQAFAASDKLKQLYFGDLSEFGFSQCFLCQQVLGAPVEWAAASLQNGLAFPRTSQRPFPILLRSGAGRPLHGLILQEGAGAMLDEVA